VIVQKRCAKCGQTKPTSDFGADRTRPDGLFPYCRSCKREVYRADHQKHKADRNAKGRADYRAKRGAYIARAKRRYAEQPDIVKAQARAWAKANPERRRAIVAAWSRRNPEARRENWRRRHARLLDAAVVPFTPEQLAAKVAYWGNRCWICGGPYEAIDHVKPLAKGGLHILANLRPICRADNTRKRDRWPLANLIGLAAAVR
jgi:5-methylcytosine-specific restriction endonuclease McrA